MYGYSLVRQKPLEYYGVFKQPLACFFLFFLCTFYVRSLVEDCLESITLMCEEDTAISLNSGDSSLLLVVLQGSQRFSALSYFPTCGHWQVAGSAPPAEEKEVQIDISIKHYLVSPSSTMF